MKQCDTANEWGKERRIEDEEELNRIIEGGKPWTIICKKRGQGASQTKATRVPCSCLTLCWGRLLDQLLRLEVASQVQHLPCGQAQQAAHTEDAEDQYPVVRRLICVAHLLLPLTHNGERLHDRVGQVLQTLQINLERLKLGCLAVLQKLKREGN